MYEKEYDESFLQFGFIFQNFNGDEQPLCLICFGEYETIIVEKTSWIECFECQ